MEDFPPTQQPPCHMAIAYGPIDLHKSKKNAEEEVTSKGPSPVTDQQCCDVCYQILEVRLVGSTRGMYIGVVCTV